MHPLSRQKVFIIVLVVVLLAGCFYAYRMWKDVRETTNTDIHQELQTVRTVAQPQESYDVIVAGTDPEGVMAAVSAARNGLSVLLVDGRDREILGGLLTLGWLNSLDLNKSPNQPFGGKLTFLNKGLFQEWYDQIEGTSFDVNTAANVFNSMVANEPNIDVLLKVQKMEPMLTGSQVTGIRVVQEDGSTTEISTKSLIDATQDGDLAAAAGVPFTFGREDIGEPDALMAVTLVFKMRGVTQEIWESFGHHPNSGIDKMSAWGFPDAKDYESSNPERVKMRGLNIGRQNDDTILINAMHLFNVDPLDPQSVAEAMAIGKKEALRIAEYLKEKFSEFRDLTFVETAPELYVRESRHIYGEYRLTIIDLMENRDWWDAVAYGSYEVDIQSKNANDAGAILMNPYAYGVPFRTLVPLELDGMLVVGKAASFDSLPHGSARVVPLGMATGEAAGAAAKLAQELGISFRELSRSETHIAELRKRLIEQGMDLTMPSFKKPEYAQHPAYQGLLTAVSMSLAYGNYDNKLFDLDGPSNALRFAYNMAGVKRVHPDKFPGNPVDAVAILSGDPAKLPLSLEQMAYTMMLAAGIEVASPGEALVTLMEKNWLNAETVSGIADKNMLTNGEVYMLIRDMMEQYVGVTYA